MSELDIGALFDLHLPNVADRIADLGGTARRPAVRALPRVRPGARRRRDGHAGRRAGAEPPAARRVRAGRGGQLRAARRRGGGHRPRGSYDGLGRRRTTDSATGSTAQGRDRGPAPWESYVDDPSEVADRRPAYRGRLAARLTRGLSQSSQRPGGAPRKSSSGMPPGPTVSDRGAAMRAPERRCRRCPGMAARTSIASGADCERMSCPAAPPSRRRRSPSRQ